MAGCECGAGVRAALTMGDGVERGGAGAGQSTQRPARTRATQAGSLYLTDTAVSSKFTIKPQDPGTSVSSGVSPARGCVN